MKFSTSCVLLLAGLWSVVEARSIARTTCTMHYTIVPGDSCWSIYTAYGLSPSGFYDLNPPLSASNCPLSVGQVVCVGFGPATPPCSPIAPVEDCSVIYKVVSGDSCYSVYTKYAITPATFYTLNYCLSDAHCSLSVGQPLCVKAKSSPSAPVVPTPVGACSSTYKVVSGDTCWAIYTKYKIAANDFYKLNPPLSASNCALKVGQNVCVAQGNSQTVPTAPAPAAPCTSTYKVVSGDTCWAVYTKYKITSDAFYQLNPPLSASNCALSIGQTLCVANDPVFKIVSLNPRASLGSCSNNYKVVSGDSCWSIYTHYNLAPADFYKLNPGLSASNCPLSIGQSVCVGASSPVTPDPAPAVSCSNNYKVVSGDSCWSIYTHYNIAPADFYKLNPSLSPSSCPLSIGQSICVSASAPPVVPSPAPVGTCSTYKVVSGDTCWSIYTHYNIAPADFYTLNPSLSPSSCPLSIGQDVCIASSSAPSSCSTTYKVVSGDTCWSVYTHYNIAPADFYKLNPSLSPSNCPLSIGQSLCVSSAPAPGVGTCSTSYNVVSGDTCWSIYTHYNIPPADFYSLNPTLSASNCPLKIGQTVCVGGGSSTAPTGPSPDPSTKGGSPPIAAPNSRAGKQLSGYYGAWTMYKNGFAPMSTSEVLKLDSVNYAFATVSYYYDSVNSASYGFYADLTDLWGDITIDLSDKGGTCRAVNPSSLCYDSTGKQWLATAPYIGAYGGQLCPKYTCVNSQGQAETPRKCQTLIDISTLPQKNGVPSFCGQVMYVLGSLRAINKNLKAVISIGGWSDSAYFAWAASPDGFQAGFVKSIQAFVQYWGWDGVDIDWEYPEHLHGGQTPPPVPQRQGNPVLTQDDLNWIASHNSDNVRECSFKALDNYGSFLKSLRQALPLALISVAAPAPFGNIRRSDGNLASTFCSIPGLSVNVMTYDIHGTFDSAPQITAHQAAILPIPGFGSSQTTISSSVSEYLSKCPNNSVRIGIPFYGHEYSNVKPGNTCGLGQSFNGGGNIVPSYDDVMSGGYTIYHDGSNYNAAYATKPDGTFVSFEDKVSLSAKLNYTMNAGMAGAFYWMSGYDKKAELISLAYAALQSGSSPILPGSQCP